MQLLKGAINTSGLLAGEPNYIIVPLKKEFDGPNIDISEDKLANLTPEDLVKLEQQGATVIELTPG